MWLILARLGSAVIVVLAMTLFVASLPLAITHMPLECSYSCQSGQLTGGQAHALRQFGFSLGTYAIFQLTFTMLTSLVWFSIAAIVFWRRSDNLVALLVAVQLVTQGASDGAAALIGSQSAWERPSLLLSVVNSILLYIFLAVFPNGRFVPRWIAWILIPTSVALCVPLVTSLPAALSGFASLLTPATGIVIVLLIAAQIYRYRAVSTNVQRQQTKWVIAGISASILVQIGFLIPFLLVPSLSAPAALYPVLAGDVTSLTLTLGPIAFMFAILRYRLYDIDVIINRTLVYGSLTGILAAVYVGSIVGFQALARNVVHQDSPVAIVVATLVVTGLFQPLRFRIQASVDRRFYRSKYDAQKTLAAFSAALRQEVDLETLQDSVLRVVRETLQPEHISLWIRPTTSGLRSTFDELHRQGQTTSEQTPN